MTDEMESARRTYLAFDCDLPRAIVMEGDETWHDGPGWYYVDDEYRDEGCCGAFESYEAAADHAREAGYYVSTRSAGGRR